MQLFTLKQPNDRFKPGEGIHVWDACIKWSDLGNMHIKIIHLAKIIRNRLLKY